MRTHVSHEQPNSPIREPISPESSWAKRASTHRASPLAQGRPRRRRARKKKIAAWSSCSCRKVQPTKLTNTTPLQSGGVVDLSSTAGLPEMGGPFSFSGTGSKKRKHKVGKSWTTTNSHNGRRQINSGKHRKLIAYQRFTAESIISQG